jgi:hypothetical protein
MYDYNGKFTEIINVSAFIQLGKILQLKNEKLIQVLPQCIFEKMGTGCCIRTECKYVQVIKSIILYTVEKMTGFDQRDAKNWTGFYKECLKKVSRIKNCDATGCKTSAGFGRRWKKWRHALQTTAIYCFVYSLC